MKPAFLPALLMCLFACAVASGQERKDPPAKDPPAPLNVELTAKAWDSFDKNKYKETIQAAEKCIESFEKSANQIQERLSKDGVSPPLGEVTPDQKKALDGNGLLNDVATCYLLKGRALLASGQKEPAIAAFKSAAKLTHARTWDPQGWYWSPAEAARDALADLK